MKSKLSKILKEFVSFPKAPGRGPEDSPLKFVVVVVVVVVVVCLVSKLKLSSVLSERKRPLMKLAN